MKRPKAGLVARLQQILPRERVLDSSLDRVAWSGDASFYRAIPEGVVFPESVEEVRELFKLARETATPITFRAAGTSLSGQAVGEGILVCVGRGWKGCEILDQGKRVRVSPGVIASHVNHRLRPYARKLGPDPASIDSCMIGGVLANNSSGMCCGVSQNAYHTLRSLRFLLVNGIWVDSGAPDADAKLKVEAPSVYEALLAIKREVDSNPGLRERIIRKYRIKNTMGYALNAFVDFATPVEILAHLMIGSEGTLGFIAEAELETVPDGKFKATALLCFDSIEEACGKVQTLAQSGAQAIEFMDRRCLEAVQGPDAEAALLVEYAFATESERGSRMGELERVLGSPLELDPIAQEKLWKLRKGALPSVGGKRPPGTSVIIEDVAVPVESLAFAVRDLRSILDRHGYREGVIFGHARDGNLHFVISQSFSDENSVAVYECLMNDVVDCIARKYGGSLKAEHGTGRNMAPFLEAEWGSEAVALMWRLKKAVDPDGILNPGVLLNHDPQAHLKGLKILPTVDPETDSCMECGFCEPRCPSQNFTIGPRQRIAVRREMMRSPEIRTELQRDFRFSGVESCAADGLCAAACPVGIDTGALIKRLRSEAHVTEKFAWLLARHFALTERVVRVFLKLGLFARKLLGDSILSKLTRFWSPWFQAAEPVDRLGQKQPDLVYFPSCVNRVLGGDLSNTILRVCERAGVKLAVPEDRMGKCCGTPFSSKGFPEAASTCSRDFLDAAWEWSQQGKIPILVDASPCSQALKKSVPGKYSALQILDSIEVIRGLLPRLSVSRRTQSITIHPVCSVQKMELQSSLEEIARTCSENVVVPASRRCCGFAGDRGFLMPALTRSATSEQAKEVADANCLDYFSTSTTCEIALSQAVGKQYRSLWHLIDEVSHPVRHPS